jgi:hypothetical protein
MPLLLTLTGCYPGFYTPTIPTVSKERQLENPYYVLSAPNPPLLQNKGEITGSIHHSFSQERQGVDLFFAHKPLEHLSYMLDYSYQNGEISQNDDWYFGNYSFNRAAMSVGYTANLSKTWLAECYGGAGFGHTSNDHGTGHSEIKQSYIFLQPAISAHNQKQTSELGLVLRLQGMHIKIGETTFDPVQEEFTASQFQLMADNPMQWMLEPGLVYRFGWPFMKFQVSGNYSVALTSSELSRKTVTFGFGAIFKINTLKTKQKH